MKARMLKKQSGFSLIELMIVVAIIGILATIAVPNFQRFQAKAKQAEAKSSLSSIYSAMKAFQAEWNVYRGDFRDIGYEPTGRINYHTGFAGVGPAIGNPFVANTRGTGNPGDCLNSSIAGCAFPVQPASGIPAFDTTASAAAGCGSAVVAVTPTATAFKATAIANLNTGSGVNDVWSMDQNKVLCNHTPTSI